jgi:hypothetical protein
VTGAGLLVTSGGAPDANWYCQFKGGARFVRGTFGVLGEARDFVWSLASFQTGSRGTLGTVALTATGSAAGGPALLTAPTIVGYEGASTAAVGSTLLVTPGTWTLDAEDPAGWFTDPYVVNRAPAPPPELIDDNVMRFFLQRFYQWTRDGADIPDAVGMTYCTVAADIGKTIRVRETVSRIEATPGGVPQFSLSAIATPATSAGVVPAGTRDAALVYQDDIEYLGSFRLNDSALFGNGGWGVAWNPAGNGGAGSFFINSFSQYRTIESGVVPVNQLADGFSVAPLSLPQAPLLQAPVTTGQWVEALGENDKYVAGQIVLDGYLYQSAFNTYGYAPPLSHARRSMTLSTPGEVTGLVRVSSTIHGRFSAGQMCHIPTAVGAQPNWQSLLGGRVLGGACALSITSDTNSGPPAYVFDLDALTQGATLPATALTQYILPNALSPSALLTGVWKNGSQDPVWAPAYLGYDQRAFFIPFGTRSVLHIGTAQYGRLAYGDSNNEKHEIVQLHSDYGGGLANLWPTQDKGYSVWGGSKVYCCWAYDLNELLAVKNQQKAPEAARPYGIFPVKLPYVSEVKNDSGQIAGGCYDPKTKIAYLSQRLSYGPGNGTGIVIHVVRINNAIAVP